MDSQKTPEAMYDEVVKAIVEAVPEIIECKFIHDYEDSIDFCVNCRESMPSSGKAVCDVGRPITLTDVLLTLKIRFENEIWIAYLGYHQGNSVLIMKRYEESLRGIDKIKQRFEWHLHSDSLEWHRDNAPETISFLHSLLCTQ